MRKGRFEMTTSVTSKLKKPYIMLLTIILLIIIALISTFAYRKTIQRKYIDNVELILNIVETDANFSYERFQLICKVWNNTILEKHDSETNQYTLNDGNFFNPKAALYNLFNDENFVKKVNAAKSRMILVQDCMDELIELWDEHKDIYPEEYEDFYNSLTNLCNAFSQIMTPTVDNPTTHILSPSQSDWMTYFLVFYDIIDQYVNCYNETAEYWDSISQKYKS